MISVANEGRYSVDQSDEHTHYCCLSRCDNSYCSEGYATVGLCGVDDVYYCSKWESFAQKLKNWLVE